MALAGPQIGGVSLFVHIVITFVVKLKTVIEELFYFIKSAVKRAHTSLEHMKIFAANFVQKIAHPFRPDSK